MADSDKGIRHSLRTFPVGHSPHRGSQGVHPQGDIENDSLSDILGRGECGTGAISEGDRGNFSIEVFGRGRILGISGVGE